MLVADTTIYLMWFAFFLVFAVLTLVNPIAASHKTESKYDEDNIELDTVTRVGRFVHLMRFIFAPAFAALSAFILSLMSFTINNCESAFATCYTSPSYNTTTATVHFSTMQFPLTTVWTFIGVMFVLILIVNMIAIGATLLKFLMQAAGVKQ